MGAYTSEIWSTGKIIIKAPFGIGPVNGLPRGHGGSYFHVDSLVATVGVAGPRGAGVLAPAVRGRLELDQLIRYSGSHQGALLSYPRGKNAGHKKRSQPRSPLQKIWDEDPETWIVFVVASRAHLLGR